MKLSSNLKPCPPPGEGVHDWILYAACCAVEAGMTDEQACHEIQLLMTGAPNPPCCEIRQIVFDARGYPPEPRCDWCPVLEEDIACIAKEGPSLIKLIARSPQPIRFGGPSRTEEIIDVLFPGNPLLCVGESMNRFNVRQRNLLRGDLCKRPLIVPSSMSKDLPYIGNANTGPRRFLVVKFDESPLDEQAALLWYLKQFAPLALIVFDGEKSCEGWFFCAQQPDESVDDFFDRAASLGADYKMWCRTRFARMPDCQGKDGKKQSRALAAAGIGHVPQGRHAVLYFDSEVIQRPSQFKEVA